MDYVAGVCAFMYMRSDSNGKEEQIYYPEDILNEASLFINSISGDVAIYKNIKKLNKLEANSFVI